MSGPLVGARSAHRRRLDDAGAGDRGPRSEITGGIPGAGNAPDRRQMIVILFTGGTITMRNDAGGGGAQPGLTAAEILLATKGIRSITAVETEEWGQFPGPHMTPERMWALRNRIAEHLARSEVTGVVITHGTDTLEESAYLVARSTASEKPVVFTGAMRTVSDLGWDGPANLFEAVQVAASPETRGFGVMVVIGGGDFPPPRSPQNQNPPLGGV